MKKLVAITIGLLLIILSGCSGQTQKNNKDNNTPVSPTEAAVPDNANSENVEPAHIDLKKLQDGGFGVGNSSITEDKDYIYYAAKDGIYRFDKKNKKDELLLKQENTRALSIDGDYIYFLLNLNLGEGNEICRIDKNGNNFMKVFSSKQIINRDGSAIYGFLIDENTLIINDDLRAYSYDMTSKEVKCIAEDVELFKVSKGYLYYIDHAERTFTIYRKSINGSKAEIVLGKGISQPKSDLYYNFVFYGEDIFYSAYKTTGKYGLYCYSNGKSSIINDKYDDRLYDITEYKGNIYYSVSNTGKDWSLMKYDTSSKTESKIGVLEDYKLSSSFKIVNGLAYYSASDGSIKTIEIKDSFK